MDIQTGESSPTSMSVVPAPMPQPRQNKGTSFLITVLAIVLIFGSGFAAALYFNANLKPGLPSPSVSQVSPIPTLIPSPQLSPRELLYTKNTNVSLYQIRESKEIQLTSDGNKYFPNRQPQFVDDKTYSYINCDKREEDFTLPYECAIIMRSIDGLETKRLVKMTSRANQNNFQVGNIVRYAWDSTRTRIAYMLDVLQGEGEEAKSVVQVRLYTVPTKEDKLLKELTPTAGRGGTPDDESAIYFSPDVTKFLVTYTALHPILPGAPDMGTMLVFDINNQSLIWSQPGVVTTFGRWLTGDTIIAKQLSNETRTNNLIKINLKNGTDNTAVEIIGEANGWYKFDLIGRSTFLYWTYAQASQSGVVLDQYDLGTKTTNKIKENVINLGISGNDLAVVMTLKPCGVDECGMDFYQGYLDDKVGLLYLKSGTVTMFNISPSPYSMADFDVR